jgi:MinD-like ATPase involved in chromosome partitioning or flagellar assembly/tetratricopeptide (TPR) repeat protein
MSETPGQVVTFYSFKGGTGRTMALANVAWILAANGKRVLVADWDLESPGLHRFFRPFLKPDAIKGTGGVIDMIREFEWQAIGGQVERADGVGATRPEDWYTEYARVSRYAFSLQWRFPDGGTLDFLSAGRQNSDYAVSVSGLDWEAFYNNLNGARFFDALRADMKANYDYTLIDSRTGLSDVADICTIHLPDTLVDCFTFSEQGIEGAALVARSVEEKYRERRIRILPVPMRVDVAEKEKADIGREVAKRRFAGLPMGMSNVEQARYWTSVEVPYQAFYAYEETLATFGDPPGQKTSMLNAFETLAAQITHGEVTQLPPMDEVLRIGVKEKFKRRLEVGENEVHLLYADEDELWAEWIESLLNLCGVRVTDGRVQAGHPVAVTPGLRAMAIISRPESGVVDGLLAAEAQADSPEPVIVYVTDMKPLRNFPMDRSITVAPPLGDEAAAERILRLIGRRLTEDVLATAARFPGTEPRAFNPPGRYPWFTGRDAVLRDLRGQLRSRGRTGNLSIVALQGLGGVGKTQLALEYAHRYRSAYDVVWWIPADPHQLIDTHLADLGARLGFNVGANAVETSQLVLNSLSRGEPTDRWLLIYDNADEIEHVRAQLPQGRGHVIIASRNSGWGTLVPPLEVGVFERDESVSFLRRRLTTMSYHDASNLAEVLGDLPIAVNSAEALLAETGTQVADYLRQIEVAGAGTTLQQTWKPSLDRLAKQSAGAYRLLQLCSVIAAETNLDLIYSDELAQALLPYDAAVADRHMRATLVQHLNRLSLARVDTHGGQIHVHRLLQQVMREQMSEEELNDARHAMHVVLAASRPRGEVEDPQTWPRFRMLWPHLLISDAVGCDDEKVRQLLIDRVRYLWVVGDLSQGEPLATRINAEWTALLDGTREFEGDKSALVRQRLHLLFNQANILRSLARFEEARALDEYVIGEQRQILGPNHVHTLMTSGSLAADLRGLGRYDLALQMDKQTYPAWNEIVGEDHPRTLIAANNLGAAYRLMGDFRNARRIDEEVYVKFQGILGPSHPVTFLSGSSLGRDYRDAGEYERSVAFLRQLYEQIRTHRGPEAVQTFNAEANLAVSLRAAGHAAEAMPILHEAYRGLVNALGEENPDTLACRLSRAVNLLAVDENETADAEMGLVIEGYRKRFGKDHPHTLVCMSSRSAMLRKLGNLSAAADLAEAAATRLVEILSMQHPFPIGARMNQAICLAEQGDLASASILTKEALRNLIDTIGPSHPDTLRCEANLALIRKDQGDKTATIDLARVTSELAEITSPQHPSVRALQVGTYAHRIMEPHPF